MAPLLEFRPGPRVAGHPLHVLLVHFPLAFWSLVFPLEFLGWALEWETGWRLAFWMNVLALAAALPTLLSGLLDLLGVKEEPAASVANRHMYVMLSAMTVFVADVLLRIGSQVPNGSRAFFNLGLTLCGLALLGWGGWLGGELVLRHRVGAKDASG